MRYPTLSDEGSRLLLADYDGGARDNLAVRATWLGEGDEVDLSDLEGAVTKFELELTVGPAPADWDRFEGRLSAEVHASMRDIPVEILDDHRFWAYLSFRYFWWYTSRREARPIANGNGLRYVQNRSSSDAIPIRLFIRGQSTLDAGDYGPAFALPRSTDLWRSHVLRVRTGTAPIVTRAFVELQRREAMRTERTLRPFARRLNRVWTNVLLHTYDQARAAALMQELHDETTNGVAGEARDVTALSETSERMTSGFRRDGNRLVREHVIDGHASESFIEINAPTNDDLGDWWAAHLRGQRPTPLLRRGPIRTVDLFSGPGGLTVGFSCAAIELGHEVVSVAAADQDVEALQIYTANHGTRRRSSRSVSSLVDHQVTGAGERARFVYEPEIIDDDWADLSGRVDVVLAGPPCQGHSNLNNKTRRTDRRNELYLTVPAVAVALGAPMVVIENVPAVIHDRLQVVQSAAQLLCQSGYFVETGVVSAARLGWPQSRQRFILVARKESPPIPLVTIASCLENETRSIMWAIADLADAPFDDELHLDMELSDENRRRIDYLFDNGIHDLPLSERPECHRNGTTYNAVYGRLFADRPAPTITTGFMTPGRGRYIHPSRRRTLTPHEAARIQGFPDTYRFRLDPTTSPSKYKLSKWLGDAVPMPLGHAAGMSLIGAGRGL